MNYLRKYSIASNQRVKLIFKQNKNAYEYRISKSLKQTKLKKPVVITKILTGNNIATKATMIITPDGDISPTSIYMSDNNNNEIIIKIGVSMLSTIKKISKKANIWT